MKITTRKTKTHVEKKLKEGMSIKDWSVDMPGELASEILMEWKKSCHSPDLLAEMEKFERE